MIVSAEGRSFIEGFEGCRLQAYLCPAGVPTIGYGHTDNVKIGDTLPDQAAADALLSSDLVRFGNVVWFDLQGAATTQHQFDAMVSLAFNIGLGGFATSTVLRDHKGGNTADEPRAFGLWNRATVDGQLQAVPGLTRRRAAEAAVYLTPEEQPHPMPAPVVVPESMPQAVEPPPPLPEGFVEQPGGNMVMGDIKDSGIVKGANVGQVVTGVAGTATVAATGFQTVRGAFAGIVFSDVAIIVLGVVAIAALGFAFFYFRDIKAKRIDMNQKGIA